MGSCCFTPRKSHFLWWYWLALATVIGAPMLVAAWYVARSSHATEEERREAGKTAESIFWMSAILAVVVVIGAGAALIDSTTRVGSSYSMTYGLLVVEFLACFAVANLAARLLARMVGPVKRAALVLLFLYVWVCAAAVVRFPVGLFIAPVAPVIAAREGIGDMIGLPTLLSFPICLVAAQAWRVFLDRPAARTAWRSAGALVLAAFLFYGIQRHGTLLHYYAYQFARSEAPVPGDALKYRTWPRG